MELRRAALELLALADPAAKAAAVRALAAQLAANGDLAIDPAAVLRPPSVLPGRPARPALVEPATLPRRSPFTREGRAALLHAVAHIEFNAIKSSLYLPECLLVKYQM